MSKNQPPHVSDWLSRVYIPDVYPRLDDPFQPGAAIVPGFAPPASMEEPAPSIQSEFQITQAGARPQSFQEGVNFAIAVGTTPVPLLSQSFPVDTIVIDNLSTALNSVFFGRGNSITVTSGLEVVPGSPFTLRADNNREMWEIQRQLEYISGLMALDRNMPPLGPYKAKRVVFDASDYFLVAAAATTVAVMLFYIPEGQ